MNWYAVKTKTKKELLAKDYYSAIGIESYAPTYTTKRVWSDRIKKIKVSAIPGYLFFKLNKVDFDLVNLNPYTTNVVRTSSGKPAVIPPNEIECLKKYLSGCEKTNESFLTVDDVVSVGSGPFCNEIGVVEKFIQNKTLVLLKSLNIKLIVSTSNLKLQKTA
jgi:transcription antitermination factor NusG